MNTVPLFFCKERVGSMAVAQSSAPVLIWYVYSVSKLVVKYTENNENIKLFLFAVPISDYFVKSILLHVT